MKFFVLRLGLVCLFTVLFVSGCMKKPDPVSSSAAETPSAVSPRKSLLEPSFSHITFNLPKGIEWVQSQNTPIGNGGVAEWVPKGYTSQNSPLRIIYQKKQPGLSPGLRLQEIVAPAKNCVDTKIARFKGGSSYAHQANVEVFCSKMGKNDWGLVSYVAVFSNRSETHTLIGEIRTAPTEKAGVFPEKTKKEKEIRDKTRTLSKLLFDSIRSVRVCAKDGNCR